MTTCAPSLETDFGQMELFPDGSLLDGPARTSAQRVRDMAWTAHALDYGAKSAAWLANLDWTDFCWRTAQTSLASTGELILEPFSGTWPRSGSMRNGTVFQLPPLTHPTSVIASGSSALAPTLTASEHKYRLQGDSQQSRSLTALAKKGLLPTLRASDASHAGPNQRGSKGDLSLTATLLLPTLTASRRSGLQSHGKNVFLGSLNPTWAEWFMNMPLGWTDLSRQSKRCKFCNNLMIQKRLLSGKLDSGFGKQMFCSKRCYGDWKLSQNPTPSKATGRKRAQSKVKMTKCERCASETELQRHHKDRNPANNAFENIEVLCQTCHTKEHCSDETWGVSALKKKYRELLSELATARSESTPSET